MRASRDSVPGEKQPPKRPAKQYALWLLGRREWSAKELDQRLRFKGYPDQEIQDCLAFLDLHGLQDDARFAEVRVRSKAKALGNRRIRQDLTTKGIDAETAAAAMQDLPEEYERAWSAASRFVGLPMTAQLNAKAWRFLSSRGFGSDAVKRVLKRLGAAKCSEDLEDPARD